MFLMRATESLEKNGPNNGITYIADKLLDHQAHIRTGTGERRCGSYGLDAHIRMLDYVWEWVGKKREVIRFLV